MTAGGALFGKRLLIWLVEVSFEALLLGLVLATLLGHDAHEYLRDTFMYAAGISMMFFTTGYLLTTLLSRMFWKVRQWWSYPLVAAGLFLIHFQIMNLGLGGVFDPRDRARVRAAGICVALLCTTAGSFILRKWVHS